MKIRIFPDGRSFINHQIKTDINGRFTLALDPDQVDTESIRVDTGEYPVYLSLSSPSLVSKNTEQYHGNLISYTDNIAVLQQANRRTIVRNYETITDILSLSGRTSIPSQIVNISYVTRGIEGRITHSIDLSSKIFSSQLIVRNMTSVDIIGAQLEVITADQQYPQAFAMRASSESILSDTGTLYIVDGRYDIPKETQLSVSLMRASIDIDTYYMIDAPNGQANGILTLEWESPSDIPSGTLSVYRDATLLAQTTIQGSGTGQKRSIPILTVPSVYARGSVIQTDLTERTVSVTLNGVITSMIPGENLVYLRYPVGNSRVDISAVYAERAGEYLLFPFMMKQGNNQRYNISFTLES